MVSDWCGFSLRCVKTFLAFDILRVLPRGRRNLVTNCLILRVTGDSVCQHFWGDSARPFWFSFTLTLLTQYLQVPHFLPIKLSSGEKLPLRSWKRLTNEDLRTFISSCIMQQASLKIASGTGLSPTLSREIHRPDSKNDSSLGDYGNSHCRERKKAMKGNFYRGAHIW